MAIHSAALAAPRREQPAPCYRVVSNRTGEVLTPRPIPAALAEANVRYLARCGFDVRLVRLASEEREA